MDQQRCKAAFTLGFTGHKKMQSYSFEWSMMQTCVKEKVVCDLQSAALANHVHASAHSLHISNSEHCVPLLFT